MMHVGKDCNRYQFECHNVDRPLVSECIAVYDTCDGIVQCNDGSDEFSCPSLEGLLFVSLTVALALSCRLFAILMCF